MKDDEIEEIGKILDEAKRRGMKDDEIASRLLFGLFLSGFTIEN